MKVALLTVGSRGDAHPFIALAEALVTRGHEIVVYANALHRSLFLRVIDNNRFVELPGDIHSIVREYMELREKGEVVEKGFMEEKLYNKMRPVLLDTMERQVPDIIVSSQMALADALTMSEYLKRPFVLIDVSPIIPNNTYAFPALSLPVASLGLGFLNRCTYEMIGFLAERAKDSAKYQNVFRAELGLLGFNLRFGALGYYHVFDVPTVGVWPSIILPRTPDMPSRSHIVGHFQMIDYGSQKLTGRTAAFLRASDQKPVFVGWGSMTITNEEVVFEILRKLNQELGCRVIFQWGYSTNMVAPADIKANEDILLVGSEPHHLLFPECCCLVHHCGAGTMAAALASGVPSLPSPVDFEQIFFSRRLVSLGVAPVVLPRKDLQPSVVVANIKKVMTAGSSYQQTARRVGSRVRQEMNSSTDKAVRLLERFQKEGWFPQRNDFRLSSMEYFLRLQGFHKGCCALACLVFIGFFFVFFLLFHVGLRIIVRLFRV